MINATSELVPRKKLEAGLERELRYHLTGESLILRAPACQLGKLEGKPCWNWGASRKSKRKCETSGCSMVADFTYDLRLSTRSFLRMPSFSITAVLSLVLGIGATTAIYSLVDQVLLHALPVRQPERLVLIDWHGDQVANGFGSWNLMCTRSAAILTSRSSFFEAYSAVHSPRSISQLARLPPCGDGNCLQ